MSANIHLLTYRSQIACLPAASAICMETYMPPSPPHPTPIEVVRDYEAKFETTIREAFDQAATERLWRLCRENYYFDVYAPEPRWSWPLARLGRIVDAGNPIAFPHHLSWLNDGTPFGNDHVVVLFDHSWDNAGREFWVFWDQDSGRTFVLYTVSWDDRGKPADTVQNRYIYLNGLWVPRPFWNGDAVVFLPRDRDLPA